MDSRIRNLDRAAATDPSARAALNRALGRIGRHALNYTGPDPVPRVDRPPPRRSQGGRRGPKPWRCALCPGETCRWDYRRPPSPRLRNVRRRRAARAACREGRG